MEIHPNRAATVKEINMATMILPLVLALVGAAIYILSQNVKAAELGRLLFLAGMFAVCFAATSYKLSI